MCSFKKKTENLKQGQNTQICVHFGVWYQKIPPKKHGFHDYRSIIKIMQLVEQKKMKKRQQINNTLVKEEIWSNFFNPSQSKFPSRNRKNHRAVGIMTDGCVAVLNAGVGKHNNPAAPVHLPLPVVGADCFGCTLRCH